MVSKAATRRKVQATEQLDSGTPYLSDAGDYSAQGGGAYLPQPLELFLAFAEGL
jgi:hypothetical protein